MGRRRWTSSKNVFVSDTFNSINASPNYSVYTYRFFGRLPRISRRPEGKFTLLQCIMTSFFTIMSLRVIIVSNPDPKNAHNTRNTKNSRPYIYYVRIHVCAIKYNVDVILIGCVSSIFFFFFVILLISIDITLRVVTVVGADSRNY